MLLEATGVSSMVGKEITGSAEDAYVALVVVLVAVLMMRAGVVHVIGAAVVGDDNNGAKAALTVGKFEFRVGAAVVTVTD